MSDYNSETKEISIIEILALGFRHLGFVLLCAFICALLVCGFTYIRTDEEASAVAYKKALAEYNEEKAELEKAIASDQKRIDDYNKIIEVVSNKKNATAEELTAALDSGDSITAARKSIKESKESLEKLSASSSGAGYVKKACISFFVGFFLACCYLLVAFLCKDPMVSSYDVESYNKLVFLGNLHSEKCLFRKISDAVLKERKWEDKQTASDYVASNLKSVLKDGEAVLLASTLNEEENKEVSDIFTKNGYKVSFVNSCAKNPKVQSLLETATSVILVERPWITSNLDIKIFKNNLDRLNKKVSGIIFY